MMPAQFRKRPLARFAVLVLLGLFVWVPGYALATPETQSLLYGPSATLPPAAPQGTGQFGPEVAIAWMDTAYSLVRAERLSPPVAARVYGYSSVTLYEAVVPGMPGYQSLAGQLNGLSELPRANGEAYYWPAVANSALATMMKELFAGASSVSLAEIAGLEAALDAQFGSELPPGIHRRAVTRGRAIGNAMAAWSRTDGYHVLHNCAYTPPAGSGFWVPTLPAFGPALEPCWGQMRSFVMSSGDACDPGLPPAYSEKAGSPFFQQAVEVYAAVNNLTAEQEAIARFWADNPGQTGTPPGHSMSIAGQILVQEGYMLDVAAEAYAAVGIAVSDAFISCWAAKYEYNLLRPVTYIQDFIDSAWTPLLPTPPFPEYSSGHSVQSAAAAQVLTDIFGDVAFTDHTHDELGYAPRSYPSFLAFAEEAAMSRLYGGIHYRAAIERGLEQGTCIGERVSELRFRKS